uniref:Uncharacterized protein n=1 Tax=Micrurus paraensis TaxID=1970185 RepID=A0A2D4KPM0_9SAUR
MRGLSASPAMTPTLPTLVTSARSRLAMTAGFSEVGVQRADLARALLRLQQLPAAHWRSILHPGAEGLLLRLLLREQVCAPLHPLQEVADQGRRDLPGRAVAQGVLRLHRLRGPPGWPAVHLPGGPALLRQVLRQPLRQEMQRLRKAHHRFRGRQVHLLRGPPLAPELLQLLPLCCLPGGPGLHP